MRRNIIMGLGLALTFAGTAVAQQPDAPRNNRGGERAAEQRGGPGMRGRGGPDGLLLKDITLTEGQRAQIAQLRKTEREGMRATREARQKQVAEMRGAREGGDTAAVRARLETNRQAMQQERTQRLAAIRNILTAEQRVAFDRNVAEAKQRQAERAQRGEGEGRRGGKGRGKGGPQGFRGQAGR